MTIYREVSPFWAVGDLAISSRSKQIEEAFELIRWTCDPDLENYFTILNGQSVLKNVYSNDELGQPLSMVVDS